MVEIQGVLEVSGAGKIKKSGEDFTKKSGKISQTKKVHILSQPLVFSVTIRSRSDVVSESVMVS